MIRNRINFLVGSLNKEMVGLEVAPWHNGLTPKRNGYNCKILDVFNQNQLRDIAAKDPNIHTDKIQKIEEVDFVGNAGDVGELIGRKGVGRIFDYILSSHNFEHLPNPIKFLIGCQKLLKDGGLLIMAIPACTFCFDYFRFPTSLSAWLDAFFADQAKPSLKQIFEQGANTAFVAEGEKFREFNVLDDPRNAIISPSLKLHFDRWQRLRGTEKEEEYVDAHCSVFTSRSFQVLITELQILNLIRFDIIDITEHQGVEFLVKLRLRENELGSSAIQEKLMIDRPRLYKEMLNELASRAPSNFLLDELQ